MHLIIDLIMSYLRTISKQSVSFFLALRKGNACSLAFLPQQGLENNSFLQVEIEPKMVAFIKLINTMILEWN